MADLFGWTPPPAKSKDDWPHDYREQFWRTCPLRVGKKAAMKALDKVRGSGLPWASLIRPLGLYTTWLKSKTHWRPAPKHPATWLNQGCWDDELPVGRPIEQQKKNGWVEAYREMAGACDDEDAGGYDADGPVSPRGSILDLDAREVSADGAEGFLAAGALGDPEGYDP